MRIVGVALLLVIGVLATMASLALDSPIPIVGAFVVVVALLLGLRRFVLRKKQVLRPRVTSGHENPHVLRGRPANTQNQVRAFVETYRSLPRSPSSDPSLWQMRYLLAQVLQASAPAIAAPDRARLEDHLKSYLLLAKDVPPKLISAEMRQDLEAIRIYYEFVVPYLDADDSALRRGDDR